MKAPGSINSRDSIFIAGYYGFENAGDEAILQCMVEHLRALRPDLDIAVASGSPEKTAARYGVRGVPWNDIQAVRGAVEQCGVVLVGGGGLFHDYWGVDPDTFLTDKHWGPVYFAGPALLAALHEKPLMLYAVGVGPLISEHARAFTRAACDAANTITVRDAGSQQLLESMGVDGGKIAVTADPVFAFAPERCDAAAWPSPVLGVSLRPWAIGAYPEFWQREVGAALDAFLEKHGGSILFLPFQTHAGERENDVAVAERVRSSMRAPESARVLTDSSPEALYAATAKCDVVLGMRLHALVFAFLNRRPFVALNYDPKVGEFLRAAGIEGYSSDIAAVDARRLAAMLDRALADGERFGAPLDGLRQDFARLARENACEAIKLLEAHGSAHMAESAAPLLARSLKVQQTENSQLRRHVGELEAEQAVERAVSAVAAKERGIALVELQSARKLLADGAAGLAAYRSRMASELKAYRSQRAWTAMLAIRKAYTLLTREGKLAFGKWLLRLPFAGLGPLAPYELPFPDVAENVPAALLERPPAAGAPAIPRQRKYDLIVFAIIDFDFRFQRPQQIAAQVRSRRPPGVLDQPDAFCAARIGGALPIDAVAGQLVGGSFARPAAGHLSGPVEPRTAGIHGRRSPPVMPRCGRFGKRGAGSVAVLAAGGFAAAPGARRRGGLRLHGRVGHVPQHGRIQRIRGAAACARGGCVGGLGAHAAGEIPNGGLAAGDGAQRRGFRIL
jgi:polysaccharide pyruvyl transferase CsaB